MKYGETLRQRSIPEWAHHNINYDEIKQLIKQHTTPGTNKPVSIPGQGDVSEREFERQLLSLLAEQHQYIILFVRSKTHEIDGRLNHLRRQLVQLEKRQALALSARIPPKRLARISRLEDDVLKTGDEIRSLSQFVNVQKLAFTKLLKKYKKWTSSESLGDKFRNSVLDQPGSVAKVDVGPLLDQFLDILQHVRELVRQPTKPRQSPHSPTIPPAPKLPPVLRSNLRAITPASRMQRTIETGSEGDLDIALTTCPLGDAGGRAVYWVHREQILELKVLLLQHMRPFPSERRRSGKSTPSTRPTPSLSRRDSVASEHVEETHVMMLDDLEAFAKAQSGATIKDAENAAGGVVTRTAGVGMWSGDSEAHVVLGTTMDGNTASAIVKPKHLGGLLDLNRPFERRPSSVQFQADVQAVDMADDYEQKTRGIREWLTANPKVQPLVAIHSRRSRFVGLNNNASHGSWATLDTDISMSQAPQIEEMGGEWWNHANDLTGFPFAVLDVRQEGEKTMDLIKFLDGNHLTERVRGFSIETHAVWSCCKPAAMSAPFWLPILAKDIRKVPESRRQATKTVVSTEVASNVTTPGPPSTAATSIATGGLASSSSGNVISSTSITSPSDHPQSANGASTVRRKKTPRRPLPADPMNGNPTLARYWSEYDHPEDGSDDEGYYIYIDPNESNKLPGQETLARWFERVRSLFSRPSSPTEDAPLTRSYFDASTPIDDNESTTSGERSSTTPRVRNYGTLGGRQRLEHPDGATTTNLFRNVLYGNDTDATMYGDYDTLGPLNLPDLQTHDQFKSRISLLSYLASLVILIIVFTLALTGRRRLHEEVDAGIIVGIAANLFFAVLGLIYTVTRQVDVGWVRRIAAWGSFMLICVFDGVLVGWMFA